MHKSNTILRARTHHVQTPTANRSQVAPVITLKPGNFYRIDNDIIDIHAKDIGAIGLAIYNVLCRFANRRTGECWPSHRTIAELLSISVTVVKKYLKKLVKADLITIQWRQDAAGDPTSNLYTLLDPSPEAVAQRPRDMQDAAAAPASAHPDMEGGGASAALPPVVSCPTPPSSDDYEQSGYPEQKEKNEQSPAYAEDKGEESIQQTSPRETFPPRPDRQPCTHPPEEVHRIDDMLLCYHCWGWLDDDTEAVTGQKQDIREGQDATVCAA